MNVMRRSRRSTAKKDSQKRRLILEILSSRLLLAADSDLTSLTVNYPDSLKITALPTQVASLVAAASTASDNYDVSGDGRLTALDALIIINAINAGGSLDDPALDVNRDGMVSQLDVLSIITVLNTTQPANAVEMNPNMRILRAALRGHWDDVFEKIETQLLSLLQSHAR